MAAVDGVVSSSEPYLRPQPSDASDAWTQAGGGQRVLAAGVARPPIEVADALDLRAGDEAVFRQRLLTVDGEPFETVTSWWPLPVAGGTALEQPAKVKGGSVTLLARLGYGAASTVEDVWARDAGEEAELLGVSRDAPVLEIFRTTRSSAGEPYEVEVMVRRAHARQRYELSVD